MSWARSEQNSGFHGSRKPQEGNNWENGVATFNRLFLVRFFRLTGNEDMHESK